jgi:hypothetical protein
LIKSQLAQKMNHLVSKIEPFVTYLSRISAGIILQHLGFFKEIFMKKLFLLLVVLLVVGGSVSAFDILSYPPPLDGGGQIMINAGLGLEVAGWMYSLFGDLTVPPLFVDVEYALPIKLPISVGGFMAYYQYKYNEWWGWYAEGYLNFLTFGVRANWHWGFDVKWMDLYTGLSLGYRGYWYNAHSSSYKTDFDYSGFDLGELIGIHFYFSEHVGAVIETGYPFVLKAGIALKFGGKGGNKGSSSSSSSKSKAAYYVVNADTLNVRSGPSADNALVGQLTRDTRVEVLDKSGQWWKIKSGKIEGYVNSSFLKEEK